MSRSQKPTWPLQFRSPGQDSGGVGGTGGSGDGAGLAAAQTTHTVTIRDFAFVPAQLTIAAGDAVRENQVLVDFE